MAAIAKFVGETVPLRRIWRIRFQHNRRDMVSEVGQPMPSYFEERGPVIAILGDDSYKICTPTRGVLRGDPIFVGKAAVHDIEYFDDAPD
jgi:hypothetical protein